MNKHDLIAMIAQDTGATKSSAAATVEAMLGAMTRALKKGDAVTFEIGRASCRERVSSVV